MITLPVPMFVALVLAALFFFALLKRDTHATLLVFIALCAWQSAVLALNQHYGLSFLRPVQPITAMIIPPAAWLAFTHASQASLTRNQRASHALGPLAALAALALSPFLLNALIPLSFASYGGLMLWRLSSGEESLPHSRLESGGLPLLVWRIIAASLIASALCDVIITISFALGETRLPLMMVSLVSSLSLLSLGALSLSKAIENPSSAEEEPPHQPTEEDAARDQSIITKLDALMTGQKSYLDPDLTLSRLARKLVIPAKDLSTAINRVKGENVSRVINTLRIDHACELLKQGSQVTTAMYDSGFNTKSNFNREFLRIKGMSPKQWLEKNAAHSMINHT